MIGYHYTTWKAYQQILENGVKLSPLEARHKNIHRAVKRFISNGCVWVYSKFMVDYELVGMLFCVGMRHESSHVVCLEIEYPKKASAYFQWCQKNPIEDSLLLTHDLTDVGLFNHYREKFDLITEPIPPATVNLMGSWDLLDFVRAGMFQEAALI